jgi:GntR family histidine utilization transcriptional repressor
MSTPRFSVIKEHITSQIEGGHWPPGTRVPSENELGQTFNVSRMTARRALHELFQDGLVTRTQGLGTFVADAKPTSSILEIRNIRDEIRNRGHDYHCEVYAVDVCKPNRDLARTFQIEYKSDLFHSILVHHESGIPVQYEDRYVNPAFAPDYLEQDFTLDTPNAYLMRSAPLTEADHTVEAVCVNQEIAKRLKIKVSDPCLILTRKTWCKQGVVSLAYLIHPGDRYRLGNHLSF